MRAEDDHGDSILVRQQTAGIMAMASCLVASAFLGALPWSSGTSNIVVAKTYPLEDRTTWENPRAVGTETNTALTRIIDQVHQPEAAVLASGRIASHLLGVRRLESVDQALVRWQSLENEAGTDLASIELFDWIVLDMQEEFQQSSEQLHKIREQAVKAGYIEHFNRYGILVLRRP